MKNNEGVHDRIFIPSQHLFAISMQSRAGPSGSAHHRGKTYLPSSYRYSTKDIAAPSKPCTFGFFDSIT
jgi:hypothetical protein